MVCRAKREIRQGHTSTTAGGQPFAAGRCSSCGSKTAVFLSRGRARPRSRRRRSPRRI